MFFANTWDMLQVCCWDLAVLACTQALRIVWRSPSRGILSLDYISAFWRIFPNNFLFDLPDAPLVLPLFSSSSLLVLLCQRALGHITELGCGLFSQPWQSFCILENTLQGITVHTAVFLKSLFSWDPKKPAHPDFWENWEDVCNPGLWDR